MKKEKKVKKEKVREEMESPPPSRPTARVKEEPRQSASNRDQVYYHIITVVIYVPYRMDMLKGV